MSGGPHCVCTRMGAGPMICQNLTDKPGAGPFSGSSALHSPSISRWLLCRLGIYICKVPLSSECHCGCRHIYDCHFKSQETDCLWRVGWLTACWGGHLWTGPVVTRSSDVTVFVCFFYWFPSPLFLFLPLCFPGTPHKYDLCYWKQHIAQCLREGALESNRPLPAAMALGNKLNCKTGHRKRSLHNWYEDF